MAAGGSLRSARPRFAQIPEALIYGECSDGAVRLYAVLDRHAGPRGLFPGRKRLARLLRRSVGTIDRALAELKALGLLHVKRRGQGLTNCYLLVDDPAAPIPDRWWEESPEPSDLSTPELSPVMVLEPSLVLPNREEGEREEVSNPSREIELSIIEDFGSFWAAWPSGRKVGKPKALKAYAKARERASHEEIMAGLAAHAPIWQQRIEAREANFVPHPTTWLNRDGWADDLPAPPRRRQAPLEVLDQLDAALSAHGIAQDGQNGGKPHARELEQ